MVAPIIILDSRFLINLPPEEKVTERIFFHLKNAYWYYHDHVFPVLGEALRESKPKEERKFYLWILEPIAELRDIFLELDYLLKEHKEYSRTIPTYGAILVNKAMDSLLVVMNYNKTVHSFPKGKVNQHEDGVHCAIREVWEEVGYQVDRQISADDYVEFVCDETGQKQRLYMILDVSDDTKFVTHTRFEIGKIEWLKISDIQLNKQRYLSLYPFIEGIIKYIQHAKLAQKPYPLQHNQTGVDLLQFQELINGTKSTPHSQYQANLRSMSKRVLDQFDLNLTVPQIRQFTIREWNF